MVLDLSTNVKLRDYRVVLSRKRTFQDYELLGDEFNIVNSINIEYDADTPLVEVSMILRSTVETDLVLNGDVISISAPVVNFEGGINRLAIFRGWVVDNNVDPDTGETRVIVRNLGHWLTRDVFFFTLNAGETATDFIRRITDNQHADIAVHSLVETTYRMQAGKVYDSTSYYDAFLDVLTITMQKEGRDYNLYIDPIGLVLEDITSFSPVPGNNLFNAQSKMWVFETSFSTPTMISPQRKRSILDPSFANIAIGYQPPDQSGSVLADISALLVGQTIIEKNENSIRRFGSFPINVDISRFPDEDEARTHLKSVIDKRSEEVETITFETYALNSLKPLDRMLLIDRQSGIGGEYFIKHLTTRISDGKYRHNIIATKRRNIPENTINAIISSSSGIIADLTPLTPIK